MAHKKGMGSTRNGRDSEAKRLGVKKFGGEMVKTGNIIVRKEEPKFTRVTMLVSALTILCSH